MIDRGCFVAQSCYEKVNNSSFTVKVRPYNSDINSIVPALKDFVSSELDRLKEGVFPLVSVFDLIEDKLLGFNAGRYYPEGIRDQFTGWVKIRIQSGVIGKCQYDIPKPLGFGVRGGPDGYLLGLVKDDIQCPFAAFLDNCGLRIGPADGDPCD